MRNTVTSLAIDTAYAIAALVTAPWWMRKARGGWSERFGAIAPLPPKSRPRLLLHAVSVGEVNLIRPLVSRLSREVEVVVSVTTDTGIERARRVFGGPDGALVVRYPLDASRSVRRFLDAVEPDAVGLVELELWPNFLRQCRARNVPVAVINGRLSERSFGKYRAARAIIGGCFEQLSFAAVQDEAYAGRFRAMGVRPERCHIAGTMKWDSAEVGETIDGAEALAREMGIDRTRPLVVAGSTAPGEHELLNESMPPGTQLLCAPRKPEWFDAAAEALPGCIRRSRARESRQGADRFLLDTIGELRKAYAVADVVVIGRSFGDLFGSDPMEAAALGKPVIIGPAFADFRNTVEVMREAGAISVASREELPRVLARLLNDTAERRSMGERARRCVLENQGATERHAALLLSMMRCAAGESR